MYGIDISNHQRGIRMKDGKFDFVIMKATEGVGFVDRSFHTFAKEALELGKLIGAYHYARPDIQSNVQSFKQEAFSFIDEVNRAGLIGKSILVLDYEVEPFDSRCEPFISAWLDTVETETGVKPFIYGSYSKLKTWMAQKMSFMKDTPLWIARWDCTDIPSIDIMASMLYPLNGIIWQYSSNGLFPGVSTVDLDITCMTQDEWKNMASYGYKKSPFDIMVSSGVFPDSISPSDNVTYRQLADILDKLL